MNETEPAVIEQTTVTLPFLDEEVPALFLEDGRIYIPVCSVCRVLGIRADTHIQRWRKLMLWTTARKLRFQTASNGKHLVWCLLISQVPFLYSLFNWDLVSHSRREQLLKATEEQSELANQAYQEMQFRYKAMRRALFTFSTTFADIKITFQQYECMLLSSAGSESSSALTALIDRGYSLLQETAELARKMLQHQGSLPIVDAVKVNAVDSVIATFSMPLLPLIPVEDSKRLAALGEQLFTTMCELEAYKRGRG